MTERECRHGFLIGWCGECKPSRVRRAVEAIAASVAWVVCSAVGAVSMAAAALVAVVAVLLFGLTGCAALGSFFGSPVGQAATETVIGLVADRVADKIEGKGYLVDEAHAVCFDRFDVPELADYFPADDLAGQVCLIPGIGRAAAE